MIDCFAGAGGMSLGLKDAGFDPVGAFDLDPMSVATYNRNIKDCAFDADVHRITGQSLLRRAKIKSGNLDLLAGGPPCQGFSRQRRGPDTDSRNDLVFEFLRLTKECRPRAFLMENVSAITAGRGRDILRRLVEGFEALGYTLNQRVLDAADYSVPQHRRRLFIVGFRRDVGASFSFPTPSGRRRTVRHAIADLPDPSSSHAIPNHEADNISELNRVRISHVPEGGGRDDIPVELRLPCHAVSTEKAGHRGVYGRLSWDKPAGTITTKCNSFTRGRFAHPRRDGNITMREAARLQSFPDTFIFAGAKVQVAHQVGNAVPPPLSRAIGSEISRTLRLAAESMLPAGKLKLAS